MRIDSKLAQIGRIAFRVEGNNWNAYFALPWSMTGAVYLGTIAMALVERKPRKEAFIELMRQAVGDILEDSTGRRPEWPGEPVAAPEHERTKE